MLPTLFYFSGRYFKLIVDVFILVASSDKNNNERERERRKRYMYNRGRLVSVDVELPGGPRASVSIRLVLNVKSPSALEEERKGKEGEKRY